MNIELPRGLRMAKNFFNTQPWERKTMAAVYIDGNKVISSFNSRKTHTISARYNTPYMRTHAELAVLRQLRGSLSGILYIYRERADKTLGQARPCNSCMRYLIDRGIKKICYSTPEGFAIEKLIS